MEKIADMLARARMNRRRRMQHAVLSREPETQPQAPRHQSAHGNYAALMRSHDRMHTRHIAGKGGANGA